MRTISSIRAVVEPSHVRISVWEQGANVGTLTVSHKGALPILLLLMDPLASQEHQLTKIEVDAVAERCRPAARFIADSLVGRLQLEEIPRFEAMEAIRVLFDEAPDFTKTVNLETKNGTMEIGCFIPGGSR